MGINAISVSFVLEPLALIDITVSMPKSPLAMSFIIFPHSIVLGTIRPYLYTPPMTIKTFPLTGVDSAVIKCILRPML